MISQIIKVKADNKMKDILYYSNGDKKCETLLFYHFLYRLSLHSKRGLKYRELLLTSTTLFKRISPKNSFSFFFLEYLSHESKYNKSYDRYLSKIRYDSCNAY